MVAKSAGINAALSLQILEETWKSSNYKHFYKRRTQHSFDANDKASFVSHKNARVLREAEKKAMERREAEEQSRQQNHVSTSSRMTEPIETPCKNKEKNTLQKEACEQDS